MILPVTSIFSLIIAFSSGMAGAAEATQQYPFRHWVEQFKQSPRGPFNGVQWFCKDGSILPPKEYACREHGGGFQHGVWKPHTRLMRDSGYLIANLFSTMHADDFTGQSARLDDLKQILLEQYLIRVDNGWVFRQARFYRGAIQSESEQDSASKLLLAILADPTWLTPGRFLLLRETVRLLPISIEPELGVKIRQAASDISSQDKGFHNLRVKIHSLPDNGDSARVRNYARSHQQNRMQDAYESLATDLDALYAPQTSMLRLKQLVKESRNLQFKLEMAKTLEAMQWANSNAESMGIAATKADLFRHIILNNNRYTVYNRLRFLRASLILEQEAYALGNQLVKSSSHASRLTRLTWLRNLAIALHSTGLLSDRQWNAARSTLDKLLSNHSMPAHDYYNALRYLARISEWSQRALEFQFANTVERWHRLTPLSLNFVPERLRSSPLLPFTRILDSLMTDAGRLTDIQHTIFGQQVGTGLRALNPGIRRGILRLAPAHGEAMRADGIYLLHATHQHLTPVAGIITRGEGSSVSHVQLLARNLGIPNMVVDNRLFTSFKSHVGEKIVMAISAHGMVVIAHDNKKWNAVFSQTIKNREVITANLNKLNLARKAMIPLNQIRARDSGRTVGPKAANLGELLHYYPDKVNPGLVLPFGLFRQYLDQPYSKNGPSVFEWMQSEYKRLSSTSDLTLRNSKTRHFLTHLRQWILHSDPGDHFRHQLRSALQKQFGTDGTYGLFVRSDTNMEDMPGFNGAGLNLTVPNVVGVDAVVSAILRVWASPFTERAFTWRQAYMHNPEHVYPAVLLMKSFASEKSGVLVTSDVDSGNRQWLSIATNEGVGGAVAGQQAEELRVQRNTGDVKLLAQASAPERTVLNPQGGMIKQPASGHAYLLSRHEIGQLRKLVDDVELRFPLPRNRDGVPVVTDIEFGFQNGKLALFQIRPFVESRRTRSDLTLVGIDSHWSANDDIQVQLDQYPQLPDEPK